MVAGISVPGGFVCVVEGGDIEVDICIVCVGGGGLEYAELIEGTYDGRVSLVI